jgi:PBP1b-binding outer membrane lipoprotein LpoB
MKKILITAALMLIIAGCSKGDPYKSETVNGTLFTI